MEKVLDLTQEQCLKIREKSTTNRIPLVTTYSPYTAYTAEIANRNWNFLKSKERLAAIFTERPLIPYRWPMTLREKLVHTKFWNQNEPEPEDLGCKACQKTRCSWCNHVKTTSHFQDADNRHTYKILHNLNCESSWVLHLVECNVCKLKDVGKSETCRLNNHSSRIRMKVNSCELTEHFLCNPTTHNFGTNITIIVIEQIRKTTIAVEYKK